MSGARVVRGVWSVLFASLLSTGCDVNIHLGAPRLDDDERGDAAPDGERGVSADDNPPTGGEDASQDAPRPSLVLASGVPWQWQITGGAIDKSQTADVFDVDLFDAPAADIEALHGMGRTVLCFFAAGTRENGRPDASQFDPDTVGAAVPGVSGEFWIDVRAESVRLVMADRLDLAVRRGCDGVQPSGVDGFEASGFGLTAADEIDYVRFLAREAHLRGLSVGLTNAVEIASAVEPVVDWALNQGCLQYRECERLEPFVLAAKAVLHVELVSDQTEGASRQAAICGDPDRQKFSTIIKTAEIGPWRLTCP